MASIHELSSGKYAVRYREGTKQRSRTFSRRDDAERFRSETERRIETGEIVLSARDVPLLEDEAVAWLASRHDLAPSTEILYASHLEDHILPELGGLRLTDLRPRRLEQWQAGLLRRCGTRSVQISRGILSQILDRAVAHEYIPANGLAVVKSPAHRSRTVEPASVEQVEAIRTFLLAERNGRSMAALVSVLAYAGLRPPQEAMALMWSDLEGPRLRVRRRNVYGEIVSGLKKGKRERIAELSDPVAAELAELRIAHRPTGLIFPRPDGQPWTRADWGNWRSRHFKRAAESADLPSSFTPYDLRHTCASLMLAAGRPLPEVANQLGHSIAVCAEVYAHVVDAYRGRPIVSIEDRIRESRAA